MIIWLNGSFGVGKTTIAYKLKEKINNSIIYDSEEIGTFLENTLPTKKDDFQDYELWRILNYEILKYHSSKYNTIIVPMTITNEFYYDEIVGRLIKENVVVKEFILIASKDTIIKRLDKRKDSTMWAYEQVNRCINTFKNNFNGHKINTDDIEINDVVENILKLL